jgi:hypothetical protein
MNIRYLLVILALVVGGHIGVSAQNTSIGVGLNGEIGYTNPTYERGGLSALAPLFIISKKSDEVQERVWWNYQNEQSEEVKRSYSAGLSLFLRQRTRRKNFFVWETGFNHSRLVYYFNNNAPFSTPNSFQPIAHLQEWFHTHQVHSNIQLSFGLGAGKALQFYTKIGGTYSWVTNGLLPNANGVHEGITDSGTRVWAGDGNTLFTMVDGVNPIKVWGIVGGGGLALHMGRHQNHSVNFGVVYYHSFDNLIESVYSQSQASGDVISMDEIQYQGHKLGYEFSYKFPIATFGKKRNNKSKFGNIYVSASPNGALSKGAMWRIGSSGAWKKSGTSMRVSEGRHTVQFKNIGGNWVTPQSQVVYVSANQTTYASGIYYQSGTGPTPTPPTPTPPTPNTSAAMDLETDMKSCFRTQNTNLLTWHEDDAKITSDIIELDFFDADADDDGDRISVCIDGDMVLKNEELSDAGKVVKMNIPTKSGDIIYVIIYTHNKGSNGRNSVGVEMPKGGKMKPIEFDLDSDEYYYFRMIRQ